MNTQPRVVRMHRLGSLLMAAPGVLGVLLAPVYVYHYGFSLLDLGLFVGMYWLTLGVGLSVGFHRHFTHGAFQATVPMRCCLAALGSMAAQGSLTYWTSIHRRHHECSDVEGDPHSPHLAGSGLSGAIKGLWHAHYAWTLSFGIPNATHYCPDLIRERRLMAISKHYRKWVLVGLVLPAVVGGLVAQSWPGAFSGLLWGGMVRLFVSSNSTWALNSICHRFGSRPHKCSDKSANNAWLALPTLGESWHNNHHAHPTSAAHGLHWWQLDLNYLFIIALEKVGLATDVKRVRR